MGSVAAFQEPSFGRSLRMTKPSLPSDQQEAFDSQVDFLVNAHLATEGELRLLEAFVPEVGDFFVMPRKPKKINLHDLMKLVGVNGKAGFDITYVKDEIVVPEGPYVIVGIEDGRSRLGVAPAKSKLAIAEEGRFGLTVFEGVVYCAMFPLLVHHGIDCVGSTVNSATTPYLVFEEDGSDLFFGGEGVPDPEFGAPSCSERKGLAD